MTRIDADIVFTGSGALLRDACIVVDATGRIVSVSTDAARDDGSAIRRAAVIMPGVVNAHTHLTDAEVDVPFDGDGTLVGWVQQLLASRAARPDADDVDRVADGQGGSISRRAVADVISRMKRTGTVAIGEVANGLATLDAIERSGMRARFIYELIGFRSDRADDAIAHAVHALGSVQWSDRIQPTLAIHAPYSVSTRLATAIVGHNRAHGTITYVHMTEDPAERRLYVHGDGPWPELLKRLGAWDEGWEHPGRAPLAEYDALGLLGADTALVHLAEATAAEIAMVADRGAHVILSPTSNLRIGNRLPPLDEIVRHDIPFALGTDGRGSNPSVDVFDEARLLLDRFEWIDPLMLLEALTRNGARALGFADLGVIEPGRTPGFVEVEIDDTTGSDAEIARRILLSSARRAVEL